MPFREYLGFVVGRDGKHQLRSNADEENIVELTSQKNLFHTSSLRRAVPFAMAKLIFTFAKAQTDAFRDFLQQRGLVATVLPANVLHFVGNLLSFSACLQGVE